jgi:hypothetical protein
VRWIEPTTNTFVANLPAIAHQQIAISELTSVNQSPQKFVK